MFENKAIDEFILICHKEHARFVKSYMWKVTQNESLADEYTQVAFIRLFHELLIGKTIRKVRAWLCITAINAFREEVRKKEYKTESLDRIIAHMNIEDNTDTWEGECKNLCEDGENLFKNLTDVVALSNIGYDIIIQEIDKLQPVLRATMLLYINNLSYSDIGDLLGIPIGTVKSRVNAAKTTLTKVKCLNDAFQSEIVPYLDLKTDKVKHK